MQIQTPFGSQQIDPDSVITFPAGLPGFEQCTRYKLFHEESNQAPIVYRLQSLEMEDLSFSVADPTVLNVDYHFELNDEETALLQTDNPSDLAILLLLYKTDAGNAAGQIASKSVNAALRAPLVLNVQNRIGLQKPLYDASISVMVKGKASA